MLSLLHSGALTKILHSVEGRVGLATSGDAGAHGLSGRLSSGISCLSLEAVTRNHFFNSLRYSYLLPSLFLPSPKSRRCHPSTLNAPREKEVSLGPTNKKDSQTFTHSFAQHLTAEPHALPQGGRGGLCGSVGFCESLPVHCVQTLIFSTQMVC